MRGHHSEAPVLSAKKGPQVSPIFGLDTKVTLPSSVAGKNPKLSILAPCSHLLTILEALWTPGSYSNSLMSDGFSKGRKLLRKPGISSPWTPPGGEKNLSFLQEEDLCSNFQMGPANRDEPKFRLDNKYLLPSHPTLWPLSPSFLFVELQPVRWELPGKKSLII